MAGSCNPLLGGESPVDLVAKLVAEEALVGVPPFPDPWELEEGHQIAGVPIPEPGTDHAPASLVEDIFLPSERGTEEESEPKPFDRIQHVESGGCFHQKRGRFGRRECDVELKPLDDAGMFDRCRCRAFSLPDLRGKINECRNDPEGAECFRYCCDGIPIHE